MASWPLLDARFSSTRWLHPRSQASQTRPTTQVTNYCCSTDMGDSLSSLKGWGSVKTLATRDFADFRPPCRRHRVRTGGQDAAPAALARTNGLDAGSGRCILSADAGSQQIEIVWLWGAFSNCDGVQVLWGQGRDISGCRSSLRPAVVGMERPAKGFGQPVGAGPGAIEPRVRSRRMASRMLSAPAGSEWTATQGPDPVADPGRAGA